MTNKYLEKIAVSQQSVLRLSSTVKRSPLVNKATANAVELKQYIARQLRELQTMPLPK